MYSYKYVRDLLPGYLTDDVEGYEGDPGYDGDQWDAASEYIEELEAELAFQYTLTGKTGNDRLVKWLRERPKTFYNNGPVIPYKEESRKESE